jgi:hypothetical protein
MFVAHVIVRAACTAPAAVSRIVVAESASMRIASVVAIEAVFRFFRVGHCVSFCNGTVQFTCDPRCRIRRMKRAPLLLSLFLFAACASKDGFIDNTAQNCGAGAEIGIRAGWDNQTATNETGRNRLTMLVEVANNSDHDITVKRIYVDPLAMQQEDSPYEVERGAADPMKVIAEGDASTFDIAMAVTRRLFDRRTMSTRSGVEMTVTVLLEPEQTYRCRFQMPMAF